MFRRIAFGLLMVAAWVMTGVTVNGSVSADSLLQVAPAVGEPWSASGTIESVDDFGFWLAPDGGGEAIYVELGPPSFWQASGVTLEAGDAVDVEGYVQGSMYHAAVVITSDGAEIVARDDTGFPLWAGGNNAGANALRDGSRVPQPQVQVDPDDWETVQGTITEVLPNGISLELADGSVLSIGLGRPITASEDDCSFAVGDDVMVLGFDLNGRFVAAEIDNLTQGGTLVLREDSGRPEWAGGPDDGMQMRQGAQGGRGAQVGPGAQTRPETGRGRATGGRGGRGGW